MKPILLLKLEGLAIFLTSVTAYQTLEFNWWLFLSLFLIPDLFMLGYIINKEIGAILYNVAHTYVLPLILAAVSLGYSRLTLMAISLIWIAHIGFDRLLGYGLKYSTGFKDTHLGILNSGDKILTKHSL
ncbi:MAG: DUF4260 domain-containing protein [Verrucomicrobia bacterium]|nr:DUF4260 domain-containing protein [Verrucomicrobiota bacterium]MDA1067361.1 DUF4260 domain-containing protein [Verrucomicrobiota bacterium]